jgi:hypothetical protein
MGLASVVGALLAVGCGSSGNATAGQPCYMATDCAPGLYCYGVTLSSSGSSNPGKCTANADMAEPPGDGAIPDGGLANMLDSSLMGDGMTTPPMDSSKPIDSSKPVDSSTPADTAPPKDTAPPSDATGG